MKSKNTIAKQFLHSLCAVLTLAGIAAGLAPSAHAATEKVIHNFTGPDGANPTGNLILDSHGNLFGVAVSGGNNITGCNSPGCGTVFELSPTSAGGWKKTILHKFRGSVVSGHDGADPQALVFDGAGNLFGTTALGGSANTGTVFELSPNSTGGWTYSVIYYGFGGSNGTTPVGGLTPDASGNLYGTTQGGGSSNAGVVFELSPTSGGWVETVLYNFTGGSDGAYPDSGVIFDAAGNLYGATTYGGTGTTYNGFGVAFKLSQVAHAWTETVLHTFSGGADGAVPMGPLVFDPSGNLYGTTLAGGFPNGCTRSDGPGCGVVYQLSPGTGGTWAETVLDTFQSGTDELGGYGGANPFAGVTLDSAGNLYGTTAFGGRTNVKSGVVLKLSPSSSGWTETVLHAFYGGTDGGTPLSGIALDSAGNLFGTTAYAGIKADCSGSGCGTVFEITP